MSRSWWREGRPGASRRSCRAGRSPRARTWCSGRSIGPRRLRMADVYLDPTDSVAVPRKTAPRPSTLDGKVVTLLDISKVKGDHLLDRIEELLRERARPKAIVRKKKPTFARPAPDPLRREIVGATDALVEALAD